MLAILKKELNLFFATTIGYLVIAIFLLINGLFLWVFKGDFNILDANFADLNSFFFIAPWFFIFMIPAITMRTFSDEIRLGTIEIIKTKPITSWDIIIGKYLGSLLLIIIALIKPFSRLGFIELLAKENCVPRDDGTLVLTLELKFLFRRKLLLTFRKVIVLFTE